MYNSKESEQNHAVVYLSGILGYNVVNCYLGIFLGKGNLKLNKELMLSKRVWAVVGANQNPEKFGNRIYSRLKEKGYKTYAVNPLYDKVEGDTCYKDLSSLPEIPEVIDIVVTPKRAKAIITEASKLGIKYIWFQPDTYDQEILKYANELGFVYVLDCVLIALP